MNRRVYLAGPFFNETQRAELHKVEAALKNVGGIFHSPKLFKANEYPLVVYSPSMDGILQDMTPDQRIAQAPFIFKKNVEMLLWCDTVVAMTDDKDTGTIWEMGFAYARCLTIIIGYTKSAEPKNVMLSQCVQAWAHGPGDLEHVMKRYLANELFRGGVAPNAQVF
jgi:nucleoside 2-deoxyribosyltransferase